MLIWTTVSLCVTGGMAALAFDVSRLRSAKGELQAAVDAAAINGINGLTTNQYFAKAQASANENVCDGTAVTLTSANVVPGNWNGTAFTANASPINSLRVTALRTTANGNPIRTYISGFFGQSAANVQATAICAFAKRADYTWTSTGSATLTAGNNAFRVAAYDATNAGAAESKTVVQANGGVTINGQAQINADVNYGSSASISNSATVTGAVAHMSSAATFPPGTQVANQAGAAVYSTTSDLYVNSSMTLGGGTYIVRNVSMSNCVITFTSPATIIFDGNVSMTNCGFSTPSNLPANLKMISTGIGNSISLTNLSRTMIADWYAPSTNLSMSTANGSYGLDGRGVFQNMSVNGTGAGSSMRYDRSLTATSQSQDPVLVR